MIFLTYNKTADSLSCLPFYNLICFSFLRKFQSPLSAAFIKHPHNRYGTGAGDECAVGEAMSETAAELLDLVFIAVYPVLTGKAFNGAAVFVI